jgi:hypothetical protein
MKGFEIFITITRFSILPLARSPLFLSATIKHGVPTDLNTQVNLSD